MLFRLQCTGFLVQYCLESLGQHCTGFLPVQYCSKSITTTLSRIFSCAILSGAFLTTFHKVFTCAMLSKSIRTTLNRIFFSNAVWSLLGNAAQGFYLCNVVPRVLRQCCLEPFGQHCTRILPVQCWSMTFMRKIIYTMLYRPCWDNIA